MSNVFIGVDFGGTKILTGAVSENGQVLCEPVRVATNGLEPAEIIVKRITDAIEQVQKSLGAAACEVKGIGLGVTGPLDIKQGLILECPQLPTLHFYPLRNKLEERFKIPVAMNNDANCLIFGEAIFGAGKGKDNVAGFTLGTGLGCALVLNRRIFNGNTGSAGEIWNSPYLDGTIEDYTCGAAVCRIYKKNAEKNCDAVIDATAFEINKLAQQGNESALQTWNEYGRHLSVALAWTINLIDPEIVVLGGSVSKAFRFFSASLEENLRERMCPVPAEKINVVTAGLGDFAGFIGAAALFLQ